jgi:hypothetical protein
MTSFIPISLSFDTARRHSQESVLLLEREPAVYSAAPLFCRVYTTAALRLLFRLLRLQLVHKDSQPQQQHCCGSEAS